MENDISKARAAGFSEHLTKPINFERLDEAIRSLLESRRISGRRRRRPVALHGASTSPQIT